MPTFPPQMQDLSEYTESVNWCIFGDTGGGKTALAGQIPNSVIFAAERGTVSAARMHKNVKGRKVWPIAHWNDFVEGFEWIEANPGVMPWAAIDSATKAQARAMRAIMEIIVDRADAKAGGEGKGNRDVDLPDRPEHQKWQNMFKRYVDDFTELPINVLWTAQAMRREDENANDLLLPYIYGKDFEISSYFCAQMDIVSYLDIIKQPRYKVRRLFFEKDPPIWAKDRYGVFGHHIDIAVDEGKGWRQLVTMPEMIAMIDNVPPQQRRRGGRGDNLPAPTRPTRARRTRKAT